MKFIIESFDVMVENKTTSDSDNRFSWIQVDEILSKRSIIVCGNLNRNVIKMSHLEKSRARNNIYLSQEEKSRSRNMLKVQKNMTVCRVYGYLTK